MADQVPVCGIMYQSPGICTVGKIDVHEEKVDSNGKVDDENGARQEEQLHETSCIEARSGAREGSRKNAAMFSQTNDDDNYFKISIIISSTLLCRTYSQSRHSGARKSMARWR